MIRKYKRKVVETKDSNDKVKEEVVETKDSNDKEIKRRSG